MKLITIENNYWNYLWLKIFVENYYGDIWSKRMIWLIYSNIASYYYYRNNIWIGRWYELTTWLCKRPRQWGHIRWQLICSEGLCRQRDQRHVARETSDKPPERLAILKNFAARWFAAHRKKICGIMALPQKKYGHSSWLIRET